MAQIDPWQTSANDKTLRTYRFNCKVTSIKRSVKQGEHGGATEFEQMFLIPDVSQAQAVEFLNAWLYEEPNKTKEGKPKYPELLINADIVYGAFRVGVDRENEYYPYGVHILVMSKYLEDKLVPYKNKTILVTALDASEDVKEDRSDEIDVESKPIFKTVGDLPANSKKPGIDIPQ